MTRLLSHEECFTFFKSVAQGGRVRAPVTKKGRGRFSDTDLVKYDDVASIDDIVWNKKTWLSAKDAVLPVTQALFRFVNGKTEEPADPAPDGKMVLLCRSCDMFAIERLDNIFLHNGSEPDSYYRKLRDRMILVLLECTEPFESCFCVSMGTSNYAGYDIAIRPTDDGILVECKKGQFRNTFASFGKEQAFVVACPSRDGTTVTVPAFAEMAPEMFNSPFWEEYAKRCIACGRCNTSCPTCSCYRVFDTDYDGTPGNFAERKRVWDGCHLDGFTTMAGGAEVRKDYGSRMRFKTFHKIYDYRKRFGVNMCVGCGRCDDVCPEYISFANCLSKLSLVHAQGGTTNA
jgi:anaerobic sulfite reductase subunit A